MRYSHCHIEPKTTWFFCFTSPMSKISSTCQTYLLFEALRLTDVFMYNNCIKWINETFFLCISSSPRVSRVKKRVSERVSPGVMHIIQSETLGETLGATFWCEKWCKVLIKDAQSLKNIHWINSPLSKNSQKPLNFRPLKASSPLKWGSSTLFLLINRCRCQKLAQCQKVGRAYLKLLKKY